LVSSSKSVGPEEEGERERKRSHSRIKENRSAIEKREREKKGRWGERDLVGKEKRTLGFRKYYLVSTDNDTLATYLRPSSIINPTHQSRYSDPTTAATADRDVSLSR